MLVELAVSDLGVIAEARVLLGAGMTALTGETGAGKTMLVDAIELLVGGRSDAGLVRPGASEARVEGRFLLPPDGEEVVLARVVPRAGRSRAYLNGKLAAIGELADLGARLVDLHGQHAHQSLLAAAVQREVLDRFASIDTRPVLEARRAVSDLEAHLSSLGGDARSRAREMDLLRYQVAELERAELTDPEEDARLEAEEELLAGAAEHRDAASRGLALLADEDGAVDILRRALSQLTGRRPFADLESRLRSVVVELDDLAAELREGSEQIEMDPARLEALTQRRQLLAELRRKYGATLDEVIAYRDEARRSLVELESHDTTVAELEAELTAARAELRRRRAEVGRARRTAAPELADAVTGRLAELAMERARFEVGVGEDEAGDDVEFKLEANMGSEPLVLARTASGGELARTMLAIRLVLTSGPPTLVFDEVDAGIGGAAATAVGRALASVAHDHQVLVVTHLPQVAAHADRQISVTKVVSEGATYSTVAALDQDGRVEELARMMSGSQGGSVAREHAAELLRQSTSGKRP